MKSLAVVIPCYNCESNIVELLSQLRDQYDDKIEVVLINDGSVDRTEYVIQEFIKQNNNHSFYLYSVPNQGAAKARTIGLKKTTAEYVAFIDADDRVSDNYIHTLLSSIEDNPDMIYYSSMQRQEEQNIERYKIYFAQDAVVTDSNNFLKGQLKRHCWSAAVWTYAFRKNLVIDSGAYFTDRTAHEDHLFSILLVAKSRKIRIISEVLYTQLITFGSLTNSKKTKRYSIDRYRAYKECEKIMPNYFDKEVLHSYKRWSLQQVYQIWRELYPRKLGFIGLGLLNICFYTPDVISFLFKKYLS